MLDINPEAIRDPDEPFLSLFTGGSTGKPKVWSKSPRNLLSEAFYLKEKFAISEKDLFVSTVPPYHIYGLFFPFWFPSWLTHGYCRIYTLSRRKSFPQPISIKRRCW
ncbi:MAG: AMP-binding protein [Smithellaceae bacterium]